VIRPSISYVLALLVSSIAFSFTVPAADVARQPVAQAEEPGLVRLRTYLAGLNSLRAKFRQEVINSDLELVEEASGRVTLKKPGRFRWDYTLPFERVIVADGERVWLYEADLQQVTVRRLDAGLGETPAALLTGDAEVLDHFEYLGSSMDDGIEWIQLKPNSAESDFEMISLGFDGDDLVEIGLADRLGQRTRLYLTEVERLEALSDDLFHFTVPDGVDVIGEGDL